MSAFGHMIVRTCAKLLPSTFSGSLRYSSTCKLNWRSLSALILNTSMPYTESLPVKIAVDSVRSAYTQAPMTCRAPHRDRDLPVEQARTLNGDSDRHNGIHVNVERVSADISINDLAIQLAASVEQWKIEKRCAAWLRVPIMRSALIPQAAKLGFRYHHAEGDTSVLFLWLRPETCKIHPFATHQVGVAGCVLDCKTSKVLVVRDKGQLHSSWKFPGGLSDLGEDIGDTAVREVHEETGIQTVFGGILAFRQQHRLPGAFGRSDLFFVCHMSPITYDIIPCADEISACRWIDLDELINDNRSTAITKHVALVAQRGLERGFDDVSIGRGERSSIYRNERFYLYSRLLNNVENTPDNEDYVHGVVTRDDDK